MTMTYDAVIIGAGPAGSSAAITLARQGWAVASSKKTEFPRRKVCGEFISATNLALLDKLGIGDAWRAEAGPEIRRVGFFGGDVCTEARMPSKGGFGRALGRDVLDRLLLDAARAAGAEIFQPWRAVAMRARGRASCRDDRGGRAGRGAARAGGHRRARLVGAGQAAQPTRQDQQPVRSARVQGAFQGSLAAADLMPLLIFPGGYGGMVSADHGRLSLSCCIRRDTAGRDSRRARRRFSRRSACIAISSTRCRGAREAIGHASLDGPWLAAGPIRPGIRSRYDQDIFRVGNIAGESHPIIAEGISMAMQSGWLLADQLVRVDATRQAERALAAARYSAAWRRLFATRIHAARPSRRSPIQPASARIMTAVIRLLPEC